MAFVLDVNLRIQDIIGLEKVKAALSKSQGAAQVGGAVGAVGGVGGKGTGGTTAFTSATRAQTAALVASAAAMNKATISQNKLNVSSKKAGLGLKKTAEGAKKAGKAAETFGQKMKLAGVRYAAFVAATAAPLAIIAALGKATTAVIEFDSAILKLRQITGQSNAEIGGMRDTILDLAVATGTSASEIARVAKVLAQAGQRGDELDESLSALSKVPLTPSFETMDAAIEGTIAALNQFNSEGLTTTEVLDVMTALSNNFAASSEDIAKGISRGGAAFEAIGGTFREFAAIFTTIRQATRESAETVGTFMKTISSRLADPKIVGFLEGKGIRISEAIEAGNPVEAITRIAAALKEMQSIQDKIEIGTKLGGRRQISRLLALVSNIDIMNDALGTANRSAGAFGEVAEVGLAGLQAQLNILAQEFNKLVQTLAEPLFIPIIKGAVTAGKVFITMVDAIKPVIPFFAQMIGFAGGFKLLAISIGAAAKALSFLSTAGIGGGLAASFSALKGQAGNITGGVAGAVARERIQRRLGGQVGLQAGGGIGAAAAAGVGAQAAGAAKAAAASKIGQLAALGGILLVANNMKESFQEAGDSAGVLSTSFTQATVVMLAAISLISGKSVFEALKGLGGSLGKFGSALGIGAAAIAAFAFAAKQAVDLDLGKIVDAAEKRVAAIKVVPIEAGDIEGLQRALGTVGEEAIGGIQESVERYSEGVSGFFAERLARIGNLVSGEGLITISDVDAQKIIDDIVGSNPALLNEIFRSAVEQFGKSGFLGGIDKLLAQSPNINPESAARLRGALVQALGGIEKVVSRIGQIQIDAKASKLASAIDKANKAFSALHIPTVLSGQLSLLSTSVGKAAKAILQNVSLFDQLSQTIGKQIGLPKLGTQFEDEAVKEIIKKGKIGEHLGTDRFAELEDTAKQSLQIEAFLNQFFLNLVASRERADALGNLLTDPLIDPVDMVNDIVQAFVESTGGTLSAESEGLLRVAATKLTQLVQEGVVSAVSLTDDPQAIIKSVQETLAGNTTLTDAMVSSVKVFLDAAAEQTARQLQLEQIKIQSLLDTAKTPERIVEVLKELLQLGGLEFDTTQFDKGQQSASELLLTLVDRGEEFVGVANEFSELFPKFTKAFAAVGEQQKLAVDANAGLGEEAVKVGTKVMALNAVMQIFEKTVGNLPTLIATREEALAKTTMITPFAGGRETFNLGKSVTEEQAKELAKKSENAIQEMTIIAEQSKIKALIETSNILESPTKFFVTALEDSTKALQIWVSKLTDIDIKLGVPVLTPVELPSGATGAVREPSPTSDLAVEQQAIQTRGLQIGILGTEIGDFRENLRTSAIDLAKEIASRQEIAGVKGESSQELRRLVTELENVNNLGEVPGLINVLGNLDPGLLAERVVALGRKQAEDPGAKELVKAVGMFTSKLEQIKLVQQVLENPSLLRDPERLQDEISPRFLDVLKAFQDIATRSQETQEPRVFEDLSTNVLEAAKATENASLNTNEAAKSFETATGDITTGATAISEAGTAFGKGVGILETVIDPIRDSLMGPPEPEAGDLDSAAKEAIDATTLAVEEVKDEMVGVKEAIKEGTEQEAELSKKQEEEPIKVEGLKENTEEITRNNTGLEKSGENIRGLGEDMDRMATAMADGVGINVETMSDVTIDVKNVSEAASEFTNDFEAVATRVIKAEIRLVLQRLARASSDAELASTFESVV